MQENIDHIISQVSRPSRYINHEWNAVHKKDSPAAASLCLCFPDVYDIGISNIGMEILYHIVNQNQQWVAERCYCPDLDLDELLKKKNIPLFSLESQKAVNSFDVVGFSLQHELCYTNVLAMLDRAGIPLNAIEREKLFPLVIAGGPCAMNPEPMALFFDAFVLGDGEDVIQEIMAWAAQCRANRSMSKEEILEGLSRISGVYVPKFYAVEYSTKGTIRSIHTVNRNAPGTIVRRTVDIEHAFYPAKQIVPFTQAVHDRLNIEIARGCAHRCRFCQASQIHAPLRERSVATLLSIAEEGLKATGFEELSLLSLSSSEYSHIDELINTLMQRYSNKRIAISLPSLRCTMHALQLAKLTRDVKKSSLTFAPEAGSLRMKAIINKEIADEDFTEIIHQAFTSGWHQIKLYYMYGLPWETGDDISAIIEQIKKAKKIQKQLNFNITISPFVPKPHTPFQWCNPEDKESLFLKKTQLIKNIPGAVRAHGIEQSVLESIFARGDRRLSSVVLAAYVLGCRFDQWKERFNNTLWQQAFVNCGIQPAWYTARKYCYEDILPWDHLCAENFKKSLYEDYIIAEKIASSAGLESSGNRVISRDEHENKKNILSRDSTQRPAPPAQTHSLQKVRLRLSRTGPVRFLSHLEQISLIRRVLRRAQLPLAYSQGFHPQPKIAFGPAISVGYSSDAEYIDVELTERMDVTIIEERVRSQLPGGYALLSVKRIPVFFPSLEASLNQALYLIAGDWPQEAAQNIEKFSHQKEWWIEKQKKEIKEKINLSSVIQSISLNGAALSVRMLFGPKCNVKPTLLIQELCGVSEEALPSFSVHRAALYISMPNRKIIEP